MAWTLGISFAVVFVCWLVWELLHAPTVSRPDDISRQKYEEPHPGIDGIEDEP